MSTEQVPLSNLHEGPKKRESLTDLQQGRVDAIKKIIGHVHTLSEDGFLHDDDPERELSIWEAIAGAFVDEMKVRNMLRKVTMAEQKLLFQVLLLTSIHDCNPDQLVNFFPQAKGLGNFRGAVHRYMSHRIRQCGSLPDDKIRVVKQDVEDGVPFWPDEPE